MNIAKHIDPNDPEGELSPKQIKWIVELSDRHLTQALINKGVI